MEDTTVPGSCAYARRVLGGVLALWVMPARRAVLAGRQNAHPGEERQCGVGSAPAAAEADEEALLLALRCWVTLWFRRGLDWVLKQPMLCRAVLKAAESVSSSLRPLADLNVVSGVPAYA